MTITHLPEFTIISAFNRIVDVVIAPYQFRVSKPDEFWIWLGIKNGR